MTAALPATPVVARKEGGTVAILALLLGGIGAHRFYLGQTGMGILYLLTLGGGFYVGSVIDVIRSSTLARQANQRNGWPA